ncbi:MAG: hypothetical protein GVY18_08625 [Bacteroidetes bacterium]|jgi:L-lactate dehydrogenase|nr:hypothetical protein [Bacteroidota bacterium]
MKVGIVGAGQVGATAAYAIGLMRAAQEVVLVDRDPALAEAQAADILHAMPFASATRIGAGGYEALADAGVVILAAGVNQQPGESRLALLGRNAAVFEEVIGQVLSVVPDPILVIATNPVDIMTTIAFRLDVAGPAELAIYDTRGQRVRTLLSEAMPAGNHEVIWDGQTDRGTRAASGTYFYRLETRDFAQTRIMTLLQ